MNLLPTSESAQPLSTEPDHPGTTRRSSADYATSTTVVAGGADHPFRRVTAGVTAAREYTRILRGSCGVSVACGKSFRGCCSSLLHWLC